MHGNRWFAIRLGERNGDLTWRHARRHLEESRLQTPFKAGATHRNNESGLVADQSCLIKLCRDLATATAHSDLYGDKRCIGSRRCADAITESLNNDVAEEWE